MSTAAIICLCFFAAAVTWTALEWRHAQRDDSRPWPDEPPYLTTLTDSEESKP